MEEELLTRLSHDVENKHYGKYRGFVADNADPERRGRLRLLVPSVLGESVTGWALPCLPFGGLADQGLFLVPEIDARVWVEFEEGEISEPLWTGTYWQAEGDPPAEAALGEPTTRLLKSPSGHLVQLDDAAGEERLFVQHPAGTTVEIDAEGTVAVADAGGNSLTLDAAAGEIVVEDANGNTLRLSAAGTTVEDANGNRIEMAAAGITAEAQRVVIKGTQVMLGGEGGEPLVKGQSFLQMFASHTHPTPVGPSGPPVPPPMPTLLSQKVTTA